MGVDIDKDCSVCQRLQEENARLKALLTEHGISWKGTLQQYAGRLHREHAGKQDVRIYDYVEIDQPQLARMWEKRQRGYRAMGYRILPSGESNLVSGLKVK